MAEEQAAHHLLNVLEDRGLSVDLDKILLGFEDEYTKAETATWVEGYLHEDTLLTKQELELYQTLKQKGLLHQYGSAGEPARPILDHEIASAIESLQTSTAAIEEQCKIMEAQRAALVKLRALDKPDLDAEHARNERRRKEGQEKARLDVAIDDISMPITEHLAETQQEIGSDKSTIGSYLSERFASDDQILGRLPGIVSTLVTEPEGSEDEKSIEQWCKAIIAFRSSEIKARVDTIFLRSLSNHSSTGRSHTVSDEELAERKVALQAELEELHSEIASIAEMVVEHELRKPMNEMRERKNQSITQARSAWLNYVLSTLDFMGRRLDTITTKAEGVDEFQQALAHVDAAASKRMTEVHVVRPTPMRRTTTGNSSAFTPMVKLRPTKTLDIPVALQDALRRVGIPFSQDSIEALQDSVIHARLQRDMKLGEHYDSTAASAHELVAERSCKADNDARVILDALFKHTLFQQVRLTDAKMDEQLESIGRDLQDKERELQEAVGNELSLSEPRVRAFVAKYGRKVASI